MMKKRPKTWVLGFWIFYTIVFLIMWITVHDPAWPIMYPFMISIGIAQIVLWLWQYNRKPRET